MSDPLTQAMCKNLLPVYNNPMIYYRSAPSCRRGSGRFWSSTPEDVPFFQALLRDGNQYGAQPKPDGIAHAFPDCRGVSRRQSVRVGAGRQHSSPATTWPRTGCGQLRRGVGRGCSPILRVIRTDKVWWSSIMQDARSVLRRNPKQPKSRYAVSGQQLAPPLELIIRPAFAFAQPGYTFELLPIPPPHFRPIPMTTAGQNDQPFLFGPNLGGTLGDLNVRYHVGIHTFFIAGVHGRRCVAIRCSVHHR
jgi:hypothetical protein